MRMDLLCSYTTETFIFTFVQWLSTFYQLLFVTFTQSFNRSSLHFFRWYAVATATPCSLVRHFALALLSSFSDSLTFSAREKQMLPLFFNHCYPSSVHSPFWHFQQYLYITEHRIWKQTNQPQWDNACRHGHHVGIAGVPVLSTWGLHTSHGILCGWWVCVERCITPEGGWDGLVILGDTE